MKKEFRLEGSVLVIPDASADLSLNVEASKAVSLKRIADALEKLLVQPVSTKDRSLFEEVFGTR